MSATFILDGSNLAWLGPGDGPSLAPVDAIADALRTEWPGCKVIALCDASLRHKLSGADKAEHQRRTGAGELVEAPADEDADAYILESARRLGGCVVTRDLYRDRRDARAGVPMLRPALIGGAVILGDPKVFPTAESDRGEPLPADAFGERVAPSPLPGGDPVSAEPAEGTRKDAEPEAAEADPPAPAKKTDEKTTEKTGEAEDAPTAESPPEKAPAAKPKTPRAPRKKKASKSASKSASTRRKQRAPTRKTPAPEAPRRQTAVGALILLVLVAGVVALIRWTTVEPPVAPAGEPGVLFARNCKGWLLAGGEERIVFHAQPEQCATSIAPADGERFLVTVTEGDAPTTTGRVLLVTADATAERSVVELTRGRQGSGDVPDERATAHIVGVDRDAGLVALRVAPSSERDPIWLIRQIDGDVRGHSEAVVGLTLAPGRAAALEHHCPAGCGTVHIAAGATAALGAAEAAPPPDGPAPRWAGPAAFAPDGSRLAIAEAFDGHRGGVVLVDVASGERRRIPFEARETGSVTGLAWTTGGLFLGAAGALYRADPAVGDWQPVSRRPESLAPALP